jgi:hypothetical protein
MCSAKADNRAEDCDYKPCDLYYPFQVPGVGWVWADCCRTQADELRGVTDPATIDAYLRAHPVRPRDVKG